MSSEILQMVRAHKRALMDGEKGTVQALSDAYKTAWTQVRVELNTLTARIVEAREAGETVGQSWLFRQGRLNALLSQVEQQLALFAEAAGGTIEGAQADAVGLAQANSAQLVGAISSSQVTLAQLPTAQIVELVGMLGNGSPLSSILDELAGQGSAGMREALIRGVALGWNPRKIERAARQAMGKVLNRALTVARTEVMRAYRNVTHETYKANDDVLNGWIWLSAADSRTCPSCWANHGQRYPLSQRLEEHVNGRCTALPSVVGFPLEIATGPELFEKLDKKAQREVLGNRRYEAFAAGQVGLEHMSVRDVDRTWGAQRRTATVEQALAAAG